jgi:hypothetical protein
MNLQLLKQKLKPELHKITLSNDLELYIHRPSLADFEQCDTPRGTLLVTVADENGKPVFSTESSEDTINIDEVDSQFVQEIYLKVLDLYSSETPADELEKK